MARFTNTAPRKAKGFTKTVAPTLTYNGALGYAQDEKTELFSRLLVERFTDTFYEDAQYRQNRMVQLAMSVAKGDPVWFSHMVGWLRREAMTRSAAVLCAAIYANAWKGVPADQLPAGALPIRKVVSDACWRADEPMELLAAYQHFFGKALPQGLRNGLADAVRALWNEYAVLKYNRNAGVTMRDVLNLAHVTPDPAKPYQAALFQYIIDKSYGNSVSAETLNLLPTIANRAVLMDIPSQDRRKFAEQNPHMLQGTTWEFLSSWYDQGGMDAAAWESAIDQMGYSALLRNLRNFEKAGVGRPALEKVRARLTDPAAVAKSRELPYRFYLAYKFADSDFFSSSLADAFELATTNVAPLRGRTLVMVDGSGSMMGGWGGYNSTASKISPNEQASVLAAIAHKVWDADVFIYDTKVTVPKLGNKNSVLGNARKIQQHSKGGGTYHWNCMSEVLSGKPKGHYARVIAFTDEQAHDVENRTTKDFAGNIFMWNLAGYGKSTADLSKPGRFMMTGFDDSSFKTIANIESGHDANWPWAK